MYIYYIGLLSISLFSLSCFRDILKISEKDHIYVMKFALFMEWHDERLQYYNLKSESEHCFFMQVFISFTQALAGLTHSLAYYRYECCEATSI